MDTQIADKVINSPSGTIISTQFVCRDVLAVSKKTQEMTYFVGFAKNDAPLHRLVGDGEAYSLLIRAINNRTRERNYFRLYTELLDGTITDEEFDAELAKNEDKYVVSMDKPVTIDELHEMVALCKQVLDVTSSEDIASLFSLNPNELDLCYKKLKLAQM